MKEYGARPHARRMVASGTAAIVLFIVGAVPAAGFDSTFHLSDPGICNKADFTLRVQTADMPVRDVNHQGFKFDDIHGFSIVDGVPSRVDLKKGDCATFRVQLNDDPKSDVDLDFTINIYTLDQNGQPQDYMACLSVWLSAGDHQKILIQGANDGCEASRTPWKVVTSQGDDHFHITVQPR